MLPDEMEAEKNRKIILQQAETIEVLRKNVYELQKELTNAYRKIADMNDDDPFSVDKIGC